MGWIMMFFTSFLFTGKIGKNGKGGGTITSTAVTLLLVTHRIFEAPIGPTLIAFLIFIIIGFLFIERAEQFIRLGNGSQLRHDSQGKKVAGDFNQTTIDEVAGMIIAVTPIYLIEVIYQIQFTLPYFIALQIVAWAFFRIFDVKKPGLIRKVEQSMEKTSAITIMLDDIIAGAYAALPTMLFTLGLFLRKTNSFTWL